MTAKPPGADPPPLTKSAFARRMGVRETTVRGWVADGMPVRADGKVNEAAARRWVETYLDRARRAARTEGASGGTVSDLRARKLSAEADLLEMDRRKRVGELVERAAIERAAEARGVSRKIDRRAQGADQGRYPPG
jgi:phage terminase Nu1 subunit (DNA packaging protein)